MVLHWLPELIVCLSQSPPLELEALTAEGKRGDDRSECFLLKRGVVRGEHLGLHSWAGRVGFWYITLGTPSITIWRLIASNWDVMKWEIQLTIQGPNNRIKITMMAMVRKYFHQEEEVNQFQRAAPKAGVGSDILWICSWRFSCLVTDVSMSYLTSVKPCGCRCIGSDLRRAPKKMIPERWYWNLSSCLRQSKNELREHTGSKQAKSLLKESR